MSEALRMLASCKWSEAQLREMAVFTPWTLDPVIGPIEIETPEDREKDRQFRGLVADLMIRRALWLLPILGAAGAVIMAVAGKVYALLPSQGWAAIEVPGLEPDLQLLPWPEQSRLPN